MATKVGYMHVLNEYDEYPFFTFRSAVRVPPYVRGNRNLTYPIINSNFSLIEYNRSRLMSRM